MGSDRRWSDTGDDGSGRRFGADKRLARLPDGDRSARGRDEAEHGEEEHKGHEDITLAMRQTRVDVRGAVPLGGAFQELKVRAGWANYRHDEIEDNGEIGTSFFR